MSGTDFRSFAVKAIAAVAALSGVHSASFAQSPEEAQDSDIVVEAPRPVPLPAPPKLDGTEREPYSGAPLIVTTVRLPVLYNDLNLRNPVDAERLLTRIDRIGRDACTYLDRLYPLTSDPDCTRKSVTKAIAAAKDATATANK